MKQEPAENVEANKKQKLRCPVSPHLPNIHASPERWYSWHVEASKSKTSNLAREAQDSNKPFQCGWNANLWSPVGFILKLFDLWWLELLEGFFAIKNRSWCRQSHFVHAKCLTVRSRTKKVTLIQEAEQISNKESCQVWVCSKMLGVLLIQDRPKNKQVLFCFKGTWRLKLWAPDRRHLSPPQHDTHNKNAIRIS